jgi:hypothetical protein
MGKYNAATVESALANFIAELRADGADDWSIAAALTKVAAGPG